MRMQVHLPFHVGIRIPPEVVPEQCDRDDQRYLAATVGVYGLTNLLPIVTADAALRVSDHVLRHVGGEQHGLLGDRARARRHHPRRARNHGQGDSPIPPNGLAQTQFAGAHLLRPDARRRARASGIPPLEAVVYLMMRRKTYLALFSLMLVMVMAAWIRFSAVLFAVATAQAHARPADRLGRHDRADQLSITIGYHGNLNNRLEGSLCRVQTLTRFAR